MTIYVILAVAILGVVSILFFTRSQVLRPLADMLAGVGEVEKGNLRHQIPTEGRPQEFQTLAEEFNKMSGEVLALRIDQYEQKLRLTESKLRYLQMQIRPHFYLNALTTIHSMSLQDRGEDIRQYIDMLSVHIRYMLYGDMAMTTVGKELEHVQNFVQMKELCFPGCVFYMDDVAAAVYVTSSYLSRVFRTETGMKITDFLTRCRIEEAKRLLRTTDQSVSDIAVESGFESFSYFSTVFKKVVGMTPVQYRKE